MSMSVARNSKGPTDTGIFQLVQFNSVVEWLDLGVSVFTSLSHGFSPAEPLIQKLLPVDYDTALCCLSYHPC